MRPAQWPTWAGRVTRLVLARENLDLVRDRIRRCEITSARWGYGIRIDVDRNLEAGRALAFGSEGLLGVLDLRSWPDDGRPPGEYAGPGSFQPPPLPTEEPTRATSPAQTVEPKDPTR